MNLLCVRNLFVSCLACCLLILPVGAFAVPMLYTYTGTKFFDIRDMDPPDGTYTNSMKVELEFITKDGQLNDTSGGFESFADQIDSWSIFDGRHTISSNDTQTQWFRAEAKVDSDGVIGDMWSFMTMWLSEGLTYDPSVGYDGAGERYDIWTDNTAWYEDGGQVTIIGDGDVVLGEDEAYAYDDYGAPPGEWSRPVPAGGGPVPEPTTMLLFGAGLVGLAGFGRKKFKK